MLAAECGWDRLGDLGKFSLGSDVFNRGVGDDQELS